MRLSAFDCRQFVSVLAILLLALFAGAEHADARRASGGGFGSRGTRTFQAPPTTTVAPTPAAPIQRSMTPQPQINQTTPNQPQGTAPRPGIFSNFGGSLVGGLLVGGLVGALLGYGFGGGAGILGMLLQIGIIVGAIMLVMRFIRGRQGQASSASAPNGQGVFNGLAGLGSSPAPARQAASAPPRGIDEIGLARDDFDTFERLLDEIQSAYGREDYAALRSRTTPEAMSYLAEELGENATRGVRNSVSDVRLLQGNLAEAWREDNTEYATLAMRYSSVDATLDRASGKVVEGDTKNATEATEVWTFARRAGADWKLSAIQST
ncbi:Tim44 domain-containing protein [Labrys miyagiensis]|uniref:Tim44 domain-containing protein n=1 Tax=Labrys miyagiensis TaxID=346912 RepID=UPI0024E0D60F|nr:Tim44 domain-containing protein [Labrys miyagiensis]